MAEIKGIIKNYRMGAHTQTTNQVIVYLDGYNKEKAKELIGKKAVWITQSGKQIKGKVLATHGNKGAVRVRFEKGLPGQAIGSEVTIYA